LTITATFPGLKVLDLATNIAGPVAAMILGDLGADVIKVERRPSGDDTRALPPHWNEESTVFLAMNRNKRSVALDLKSEPDRARLLDLAAKADVVIESFPPGLAGKLNLRWTDFQAVNPQLILCSVSAFGNGPIGGSMGGYDALVQAVSGMMSFTGNPGEPSVRIAPSVLDLSTGMWGAIGIMAALARRKSGGNGEHVNVALIDTAFTLMSHQVLGLLATGDLPQKLGSGAPSAAPYRVYAASDGELMIATASDPQFPRLCMALGLGELGADPALANMAGRLAQRDRIDSVISKRTSTETVEHWLTILARAGISCGRVNDVAEALELPVVQERGLFVAPETIGWADGLPLIRLPIDPDGGAIRRRPPSMGEHDDVPSFE
jgi:crotonobetainyl-CoA:carnitine CoA-transferase CaiB-like acyl-CoA transferase